MVGTPCSVVCVSPTDCFGISIKVAFVSVSAGLVSSTTTAAAAGAGGVGGSSGFLGVGVVDGLLTFSFVFSASFAAFSASATSSSGSP